MRAITLSIASIALTLAASAQQKLPSGPAIDAQVKQLMTITHANGIAVSVIDHGKVGYTQAYGIRDAKGDPLTRDTVMYGASVTKMVFGYHVMQLVDQHKIALDTPLKDYLAKPLPTYGPDPFHPDKYGPYKDLANEPRWQQITPRICLMHSTGFANFAFLEPDQKLRIHFDPGTHFSYSGEGLILLQFVIEHGKSPLGVDLGEMTDATFKRLGMTNTSLTTRPDFRTGWADGWDDKGTPRPHSHRTKVRVAGSMDTTISDLPKFVAALVRGDGLSAASRAEMVKPSLHITTATQFPTFLPDLPVAQQRKDLAAGIGVVVFDGLQGHGFFKGGHDEQTANMVVCLERGQRCVVILSNDVRAEAGFAELVKFILGETGVPFDWEYGDNAGKS